MKTKRFFYLFSLFLAGLVVYGSLNSCSSILNGTSQNVTVNSNTDGAQVWIDGISFGKTPYTAKLQRGEEHLIEIKKDGFETYRITTSKEIAGAFGQILFAVA
jgi:hypothetical protein